MGKESFINFALRELSTPQLELSLNDLYVAETLRFSKPAYFGPSGARELAVALLMYRYEHSLAEALSLGIEKVFKGEWGPLQLSDYFEYYIKESNVIPYSSFSEVYRYIDKNCRWIDKTFCARGSMGKGFLVKNTEYDYFDGLSIASLIGLISFNAGQEVVVSGFNSKPLSGLDILDLKKRMELSYFINSKLDEKRNTFYVIGDGIISIRLLGKNAALIYQSSSTGIFYEKIKSGLGWGVFDANELDF